MNKVEESLGEVLNWKNLNRDILCMIFDKLDVMDITMGASRVCISWFLASHRRSLWNTVDLTKVYLIVDKGRVIKFEDKLGSFVLYKHFVNNGEESGGLLMNLLIEITKLSGMVPKNLFFNFGSHVDEDDLKFAAKKMPNIEKLVLPVRCYHTRKASWFAFSQWKNLTTLIIVHEEDLYAGKLDFQAVGENCSNLTNLKYICNLQVYHAEDIVRFLQCLKRLSLRCSLVPVTGVSMLITGLKNLTILNLSHCKDPDLNPKALSEYNFSQAAIPKLEKIITCCQGCSFCEGPCRFSSSSFFSETWHNDEIKEFEF